MDDPLIAELQILRTLIGFDTTSRGSNLEMIAWIERYAAELGLRTQRVANAQHSKANLILRIGPDVAGGVVLSGHTDVVPVDGQVWSSDPWQLSFRDGRYFGRGTADMKGFLALIIAGAARAATAPLLRPLILAFTYDEEVGCLGVPSLIEYLGATLPPPAAVIVGEPTRMRVVLAHKGLRIFHVEVTGKEAHSSSVGVGIGVSAITAAVELMGLVARMNADAAALASADSQFKPPGATMTVGKVDGGTAANILARRCRFTWDLRAETAVDADHYEARFRAVATALDSRLREIAPDGGVNITRLADAPALEFEEHGAAQELATALTDNPRTGCVSFVAEAGLFRLAGLSAVLCGPGSIDQAHQPDEWIAHEQLVAGKRFVDGVIARLCA